MKRRPAPRILNSRGELIVLNSQEKFHANWMQRQIADRYGNALGYEINVTTLTSIVKKVSEQKYFKIAPADYVPVRVGEGSWSTFLTTFRTFALGDDFETGILNTGRDNARMATADSAVDALNVKVQNWAKQVGWTIMDLAYAAKTGNYDLVSSKEEARKENWDLGLQKLAFLGLPSQGNQCLGLLNQPGVMVDTATLTKAISAMTATELSTFCQLVVEKYRANCNRTAYPTHFIVPESDFNGMAVMSSPSFPIKSVKQVLEETFQTICQNAKFKILPCAYADKAYNTLGKQVYTLLNYDEKSVRMDIPVDYTNTLANSLDSFGFQNVGYGQFTGVVAYRPLEMYYFQF